MMHWLKQLDDLLRGKSTRPELLAQGRMELPLRSFILLAILLGAIYGFFMGWFSAIGRGPEGYLQLLASTIKLPALFLLTLLVTFPSLYVFNALVGSRLNFEATLRLLVAAIVVNLAVAASFGPILGFFTVSTTSYSFMVLLNVLLLGIGGVVGLAFLLQTLRRLASLAWLRPTTTLAEPPVVDGGGESPPPDLGALDIMPGGYPEEAIGTARSIFRIWVIIYALVGVQMGWLLRPFIGSPSMPFTWFRVRDGNFFMAVMAHLRNLFGISLNARY